MVLRLVVALLLAAIIVPVAWAQAPIPSPTASSEPVVILSVTNADLELISAGLQTQPFGKVMPLVQKLQAQIVEQQQKAAAVKPEEIK